MSDIVVHPAWSSYIPILVKAMAVTDGPVLELGMGPQSTPLLHWLCKYRNRKLVSYDSDPDFFQMNKKFASEMHEIRFVEDKDWPTIDTLNTFWSVVFIDQKPPEARGPSAIRLAHNADYILLHDSDSGSSRDYHYRRVYPHFKYYYKYRGVKPNTSVVSNFKDLTAITL